MIAARRRAPRIRGQAPRVEGVEVPVGGKQLVYAGRDPVSKRRHDLIEIMNSRTRAVNASKRCQLARRSWSRRSSSHERAMVDMGR